MLKEVTEKEFRELVNQGLVLADFFSSTCGPCKMLSFCLCGQKNRENSRSCSKIKNAFSRFYFGKGT